MNKKVYRVDYAAKLAGVHKQTIIDWNKRGQIKIRAIDGIQFVTHADLLKIQKAQIKRGKTVNLIGSNPTAS